MIEVSSLTKIYGGLKAVDNISFKAEKGEILGFLGPNGAGKTTTMRVIAGSLGATAGTAKVAGFEVHEKPHEVKRRLGYMPEFPPLYNAMTVEDYLAFAGRIKGVARGDRKGALDKVTETCGLARTRKRIIGQLSKGYRQRVGLAQALIHDPEVLVLDEPTSGLDPAQISEVRDVIKGLRGEHTVILSTHILPEVELTCDRVVIINRGEIIAQDTVKELGSRLAARQQLLLRVARPDEACVETLEALEGVTDVAALDDGQYQISAMDADLRERLSTTVVDGGWGLLELRSKKATLEDIYLSLVTGREGGVA